MKIALVILHADPMRGGAERYTIDLAAALKKREHDVSLLATSFSQTPAEVKQVQLESRGLTRSGKYQSVLNSLDAHFFRNRYDIVHAMFPIKKCDVYHPHAGLASAAVTDDQIGALFNPRRRAMAQIEQSLLVASHPPQVLCLSEYVKRTVKRYYPLNESHLPILFNAVDTAHFDPARISPEKKSDQIVALMIAQDFARKGLREAILALAKVPQKNLILRVIGKQDTGEYEKLAEKSGVSERVQFAGTTTNPAQEYRNADFFVLPTKHDPCSLVVLEALAMGLPVISTQLNGACEIMADGTHGFVLSNPNNIDSLADAMKNLLDPDLRSTMSAACLELRTKLSYENHLDRLLQIYAAHS